jgi:hypothetical protein
MLATQTAKTALILTTAISPISNNISSFDYSSYQDVAKKYFSKRLEPTKIEDFEKNYNTFPSKQISDILSKLNEIDSLQENWDEDGAVKPNNKAINNSINFVKTNLQSKALFNLDVEDIIPTPYGTIEFTWYGEKENSRFIIEIGKSLATYIARYSDARKKSNHRFDLSDRHEIFEAINDLEDFIRFESK